MTSWTRAFARPGDFLFIALMLASIAVGVFLAVQSGATAMLAVPGWFDPIFFQYNLVLALLAILVVPSVTFIYVRTMRGEKRRRLDEELTAEERALYDQQITDALDRNLRFGSYLGSIAAAMVVLTLGISIILFLKPVFGTGNGVDYAKGANFLLLGPFIEYYTTDPSKVYHHLIVALTAFQFGFLGAYIYFVSDLVRRYFTVDLSPHTFVESAIRMARGSVLALVVSFILPLLPYFDNGTDADLLPRVLPVVSFFIGFFPNQGLLVIKKMGEKVTGTSAEKYNAHGLTQLSGMSYAHETRLQREGYDNLENLSHTKPIGLALCTGFSFRQLEHWIGQAWLMLHLGDDYTAFKAHTGITSREELAEYVGKKGDGAIAQLTAGLPAPLPAKVDAVSTLL